MSKLFEKEILSNTIFVTASQIFSLIISILLTFLLPLFFSMENFGYWQIYLLYVSYVALFTLGFNDGIYLKYGHLNENELPAKIIRSSVFIFFILLIIQYLIISSFFTIYLTSERLFIFQMIGLNVVIMGLNGTLSIILMTTNQLKKYSFLIIFNKILMLIFISLIFIKNINDFKVIILSDLFVKVFILAINFYLLKNIFIGKISLNKKILFEFFSNIKFGSFLLLANLSGMLILGLGRILVERFSSIEIYSVYSLGISVANIILVFVTSASLVLYPTLKRISKNSLPQYFLQIKKIVSFVIFTSFFVYYIVKIYIHIFLPEYYDLIEYLPYLFLVIAFQAKIQLLNNSFYKTLRKEREMFSANSFSFLVFSFLAVPTYYFHNSVILLIVITLVINLFRAYASELSLSKYLKISDVRSIYVELSYMMLFLISTIYFDNMTGILALLIAYLILLWHRRIVLKKILDFIFKKKVA